MSIRRSLRYGDRGDDVRELQQLLVDRGFDSGQIDGIFGDQTEQAVVSFQASCGLDQDGVVGPRTWGALGSDEEVEGSPESALETSTSTHADWTSVDGPGRMRYGMARLIEQYGYPVNGAAGIVGNLWAESEVLPMRIEGSSSTTPMRSRNFSGATVDFTATEIMGRDRGAQVGPALPGVGLAQWTSGGRRGGLFQHEYQGQTLGAEILFDMDAQIDYLVHELRNQYLHVHAVLAHEDVSVENACDEVLYNFEVPGSVLDQATKLPRTDPRVQRVFQARRIHARAAVQYYEEH
ncbi:phage tail tip lysozyme [Nocardioides euryhalodurans]|uniref:Peptidoglycan-binding protein n=1 Tax=Nocardioides euryhalodurans TaxID=2518370 RepID=A0A4P7GJC4_9ACTN|nr:phage tail tip lysozyme [Nocardioides euryhalodurans]QBR91824.1 hypothetical protein EXE57_05705 [Nocardioides euryhalodurans]